MKEDHVNRAKEAPDFVIDDKTGALLNTNDRALKGYRAQRESLRKTRNDRIRIEQLENRLDRIEQLLLKVLEK